MHPMFDLQAAKSCKDYFSKAHAYATGTGWNLFLEFTSSEQNTNAVLVKSRTTVFKEYKSLGSVINDANFIGFDSVEVHINVI